MLKRYVRQSKYDPLVDEVELLESNPKYARIRYPDGRESSVSLHDLAPCGENSAHKLPDCPNVPVSDVTSESDPNIPVTPIISGDNLVDNSEQPHLEVNPVHMPDQAHIEISSPEPAPLRISQRARHAPDRLDL